MNQKEEARKRVRERYIRLKAAGICTSCGTTKVLDGKITCPECRMNHKRFYVEAKQKPEHRPKHRRQLKQWRDQNLAYCNNQRRAYLKKLRDEVLTHYGGLCVCCGEPEFVFLSIDHINNDGKEDREDTGGCGGAVFYRKIQRLDYPLTLQILCHNCNQAKRILGYCPHHPEWSHTHVWYSTHCTNCGCEKSSETIGTVCIPLVFTPKRQSNSISMVGASVP